MKIDITKAKEWLGCVIIPVGSFAWDTPVMKNRFQSLAVQKELKAMETEMNKAAITKHEIYNKLVGFSEQDLSDIANFMGFMRHSLFNVAPEPRTESRFSR